MALSFFNVIPTALAPTEASEIDKTIQEEDFVIEETTPLTQQDINNKIEHYSLKWGVSVKLVHYIVKNESSYNKDAVGDMNIACPSNGYPVRARGPVQITECYYPQVTDEEAFDWDFSLNFLAKKLANGKCSEWTTCRNYYHLSQK